MKDLENAGNLGQNDDDALVPDEIPVEEKEVIVKKEEERRNKTTQ